MRRVNHCLNKQLLDICQQAVWLDKLNLKLAELLPEHLRAHCKVGSFNRGCLVLVTDKPAMTTELRYSLPALRDALRGDAGLYQLLSIKIHVDTGEYQQRKGKLAGSGLSDTARDAIKTAGETCSWPPLKEALLRLAGRVESLQK